MRVFDEISGSFTDYNLCACSSYADYRFGSAKYYGKVSGISYTVTLSADEKLAVKYYDVSLDGTRAKLDLICRVLPCLGQRRDIAGIYMFETDTGHCAVRMSRLVSSEKALR
jgi:hypothetical protein